MDAGYKKALDFMLEYTTYECSREQRACISALKKQIPKKVKYIERTIDGYLLGYCPKCTLKIINENKFCYECGQALDWSE